MEDKLYTTLEKFKSFGRIDLNSVIFTLWAKKELDLILNFKVSEDEIDLNNVVGYAIIASVHIRQGDLEYGQDLFEHCINKGLDKDIGYKIIKEDAFDLADFEIKSEEKVEKEIDVKLKSKKQCTLSKIKFEKISDHYKSSIFENKLESFTQFESNFLYRPSPSSDESVIKQVFIDNEYNITWIPQYSYLNHYYRTLINGNQSCLIIDAGANIGASSLYFTSLFPGASILAIEPDKDNCELIRLNCMGRPITLFEGGLSSKVEKLRFSDPGDGEWAYRLLDSEIEVADTNCIGIIDILNSREFYEYKLLVVKVDIEGGEARLFSENTSWLDKTPLLVIELHDWMLPDDKTSRVVMQELVKRDFDIFTKGENLFCFNRNILN